MKLSKKRIEKVAAKLWLTYWKTRAESRGNSQAVTAAVKSRLEVGWPRVEKSMQYAWCCVAKIALMGLTAKPKSCSLVHGKRVCK
jgi:hypothetical protein